MASKLFARKLTKSIPIYKCLPHISFLNFEIKLVFTFAFKICLHYPIALTWLWHPILNIFNHHPLFHILLIFPFLDSDQVSHWPGETAIQIEFIHQLAKPVSHTRSFPRGRNARVTICPHLMMGLDHFAKPRFLGPHKSWLSCSHSTLVLESVAGSPWQFRCVLTTT